MRRIQCKDNDQGNADCSRYNSFHSMRALRAWYKLRLKSAITAFALLKCNNRVVKILLSEVGPQRFGDIDFGVCNLPKQKVADPQFTAGANQQIRVRQSRS